MQLSPLTQASELPIRDAADNIGLFTGLQVDDPAFDLGICDVLMFGSAVVVRGRPSSSLLDVVVLVPFPDTVDDGTLWDDALTVVASNPRSCSKELLCDAGVMGGLLMIKVPSMSSNQHPSE